MKKNPYKKTVCKIGYLGTLKDGTTPYTTINGKPTKEYTLWRNMLKRCYDSEKPTYKNVTVCERWHNFSQFLEDLPKIKGYDLWKNGTDKKMALNKDMYYRDLGINTDCKEYSLETCQFITQSDNSKESMDRCGNPKTPKKVKCVETGEVYESTQQAERETGIPHQHISQVCRGKLKSCKGLHFVYID